MADRANKFMKDFKNKRNLNATEEIVQSLIELQEIETSEASRKEEQNIPHNMQADTFIIEETPSKKEESNEENPGEKGNKKEGKKLAKKNGKKSNAGRKPFKTGEYKKITIDIPQELYDAMQDFLGAFDNNMTLYIKNALTNDINANYDEYYKQAQALKDSKPILKIKRK